MRCLLLAAMLAALSAQAHATSVWCQSTDGTTISGGCEGVTTPPPSPTTGWAQFDLSGSVYQAWLARPTPISSAAFQQRFTAAEQAAIWQAATANAALGAGLVQGLSGDMIDLTGCPTACNNTTLKSWMDGLVAAGAITSAREAAVLTP